MRKLCLIVMMASYLGVGMASEVKKVGEVRLIHVPDFGSGIVFVQVLFEAGSLFDPPGKEGLAYLTARALLRGTKSRTHEQIVDEVAYLGAELESTAQKEFFGLYGNFMPRFLERFAGLIAEILAEPTFPEEGFEQERSLVLEELTNLRDDDAELARYFYSRFLYKEHPLGRPTMGYMDTVRALTAADCRLFFGEHAKRGNLIVVLAGDIGEDEARRFVEKIAQGIRPGRVERKALPAPPEIEGLHVLIVDKPERTQTQVVMGHPTLGWRDPDLFPLFVGSTAFGGTFTSRLVREIRERRGWSYGVSAAIFGGKEFGTLSIRFFPASKDTVAAINLAIEMVREVAKNGLSEQEVDFARNHLVNQFPFRIETARKRADEMLADIIYGRPAAFIATYVEKVRKQKTAVVNRVLARALNPDGMVIVVVGTATDLLKDFKALPGLRSLLVQPYDKDRLEPQPALE